MRSRKWGMCSCKELPPYVHFIVHPFVLCYDALVPLWFFINHLGLASAWEHVKVNWWG